MGSRGARHAEPRQGFAFMRGSVGGRKGVYLATWRPPNGCCQELLGPCTVGSAEIHGHPARFLGVKSVFLIHGSRKKCLHTPSLFSKDIRHTMDTAGQ